MKLRRLVFFGSYLRGADLAHREIREAMVGPVRAHWGLGSRALADVFLPGMSQDELNEFTRRQRTATDGETAARLLELTYTFDATFAAASVDAPALVLHRRRTARSGSRRKDARRRDPRSQVLAARGPRPPTLGRRGVAVARDRGVPSRAHVCAAAAESTPVTRERCRLDLGAGRS